MNVKGESEVTQSCLTLSDPMGCSLPSSSVHGIFQARVLEWGAIAFSKGSPRTCQLCRLCWAYSTKWEKYLSIIYLSSNIWDIVAFNIIFIIILWVKFIVDFSFSVPVCSETEIRDCKYVYIKLYLFKSNLPLHPIQSPFVLYSAAPPCHLLTWSPCYIIIQILIKTLHGTGSRRMLCISAQKAALKFYQ